MVENMAGSPAPTALAWTQEKRSFPQQTGLGPDLAAIPETVRNMARQRQFTLAAINAASQGTRKAFMAVWLHKMGMQVMTGLVAIATPLAAASAQSYPPPASPDDYPPPPPSAQGYPPPPPRGSPYQGQYQGQYGQQYNQYDAPPPDSYTTTAPPGYIGTQVPPPPPGYQQDPVYAQQVEQDRHYEAYAEDWAQRYCVRSGNNAGSGAVIGGLLGALLGSSVAGRHDRGAGFAVGGVMGAVGGAAIGSASGGATSPGCPPGYVVRGGAPAFYFGGYGQPYYYAAPAWYRPWVFIDNRWTYRPYPYRGWYYRHYGYGRPGYGYRNGYGHRRY
jgi:hypothetical protein